MKSRQKLPQALAGSVVVQEVDGETLVYDMKRHRVHCLNRAAAALWRACDGRRGVEELARELQDRFPEEVSSAGSKLLAEQILMNLSRARLVTGWTGPAEGSQSRREWLRNTGGFYL
ncbi:MAG: PqqD family protein, partial [Armatimonadetes bacterium]|nr:PqqD family protein [Armatimonadota bacterium]